MASSVPADLIIPPRPQLVEALMRERNKEDPDLKTIERLISADIGVAGALLKAANSPAFGARQKMGSLSQAMQMLGMRSVVNMASAMVLRYLMKGGDAAAMERFWDTTEHVATLCGQLARQLRSISQDEAYAFGLFHDCGIPVLMLRYPNYKDVLRAANAQPERAFTEAEDEFLGTNHSAVGGLIARNWGLPDEVVEAIQVHHDLDFFTDTSSVRNGKTKTLIGLVHLAEHVHHASKRGSDDIEWSKFSEPVLAHFGLSHEDYNDLMEAFDALPAG